MKIKELDQLLKYRYPGNFDKDVAKQFPNLYKRDYGFAQPTFKLHDCLIGVWLKWHHCHDIKTIRQEFDLAIETSISIANDANVYPYFRSKFDNFLIQLSIIIGDKDTLRLTAETVGEAQHEARHYQMFEAWTGILKYRILGQEDCVRKQYELFKQYSIVKYYVYPTRKMIQTFVEKDYKTLITTIKKRSERFWDWNKTAFYEEDGERILDPKKLNPNFFWPWVECTFAKLACLDGAGYRHDSFWLPLGLIKASE